MHEQAIKDKDCLSFTVEDPSEDFQVVRDIYEASYLIERNLMDFLSGMKRGCMRSFENIDKIIMKHEKLMQI